MSSNPATHSVEWFATEEEAKDRRPYATIHPIPSRAVDTYGWKHLKVEARWVCADQWAWENR